VVGGAENISWLWIIAAAAILYVAIAVIIFVHYQVVAMNADLAGCLFWFATFGLIPCVQHFDPVPPPIATPHKKAKAPLLKPAPSIPLPPAKPVIEAVHVAPEDDEDATKPEWWRKRDRSMPPPEFDYPYKGELTVTRDSDEFPTLRQCRPPGMILGCARVTIPFEGGPSRTCSIWIAPDSFLEIFGTNYEEMLRHELAHCNGWPSYHPGARAWPGPLPQQQAKAE